MFRSTISMAGGDPSAFRGRQSESRRFVRDEELSFGATGQGNAIIHGENNEAVDLLKGDLRDTVKCIYIDPPYNNRESYSHYDDNDTHEVWIESVVCHIEKLYQLLCDEGSLWISIDDWQLHYLKVEVDRIFGRSNFISTIVWQHRTTRENRKVFSNNHEYVLVYTKNERLFKKSRNLLPYNGDVLSRYRNLDGDPRGPWQSVSLNVQAGHATKGQFYEIVGPSGRCHAPPNGRCRVYTEEKMKEEIAKGNVWFGRSGDAVPRQKRFLKDAKGGLTPQTFWTAQEVGTTDHAKKHLLSLFPEVPVFDTPKPERLIQRIIEIAGNEGDIVLDSYLGSGTTAAVAHRLRRRYVGIESGEHVITHCAERLRRLVESNGENECSQSRRKQERGVDFLRIE